MERCPFCGNFVQLVSVCSPRYVYCENCFTQGPHGETENECVGLWNSRHTDIKINEHRQANIKGS